MKKIMKKETIFSTIIIGGSYAGLSAAMTLGRSLRQVLVIDSGLPCNRQTPHSHNFLTRDGAPPKEILQVARQQVEQYAGISFHEGIASKGNKIPGGFEISTSGGATFKAKTLVFATGIKDVMPGIKGFSECWGVSVIHCPYCHGYEVKGKKTAIMLSAERLMHFVPLIKNLTGQLTLLIKPHPSLGDDEIKKLKIHGISILDEEVIEIEHSNGYVKNVVFKNGTKESFEAIYAPVPFEQHCHIPQALGCELTEDGLLKVDPSHGTTIPGVYAVGDNAQPMRSVALAVAAGNIAGAIINNKLSHDDFQ